MAGVASAHERAEVQNPDAGARSREDSGAAAARGEDHAARSRIVMSEMEKFVSGLQLNQGGTRKPEAEDMFTTSSGALAKDGTTGMEVMKEKADVAGDQVAKVGQEEEDEVMMKPDELGHEAAVGKGLAGALRFLKERGTLHEDRDKERSKPVRVQDGAPREIRIERTDEFGRVMTPKEAFRELSHKFHGKGSGKTKQEKRQRKHQDELRSKRMKSNDTPLLSAEKMRDAQARGKTPYLVLTGNAKYF